MLKRFVLEIADNIKKISEREDEELTLYFDDVIDHIDKVIETLEESRETNGNLQRYRFCVKYRKNK